MQDRITIRFSNPRDLKDLKLLAEKKKIKLNRLVTRILIQAVELEEDRGYPWDEYLDSLEFLKKN